LHTLAKTRVSFDDPNLISHPGLVPLSALAERAGLRGLAAAHVRPGGGRGANAGLKVACLAAGMAAGADSIDDMGLLRHGATEKVFGGVRAPSTLGSFVRAFTWGNVSQLNKVHREFLVNLAGSPLQLPSPGSPSWWAAWRWRRASRTRDARTGNGSAGQPRAECTVTRGGPCRGHTSPGRGRSRQRV